jgi:poly-gamma-glutamate capsule biosynthesis protein CapA/YwtB (metallophosphatase superfamily)
MDRRTFLKTAAQTATVASIAGIASVAGTARKALGSEAPAPSPSGPLDRLTLAAVGDCILARRVSQLQDPDFLALVDLLHGVDCAWGNAETVLADPRKLYPSLKGGDPHAIADPWAADELRALGLQLMGTANNHTLDFGYDGLFRSLDNLDRVGIAHAGAGADLALAARPGTFDSAAGRIADVNCASTFASYFPAGPAHPYVQGRPGINALHVDPTVQVDAALFAKLKELNARMEQLQGFHDFDALIDPPPPGPKDVAQFLGTPIKLGAHSDFLVEGRKGDVERIVQAIRTARHNSRVVIASIHSHEAREVLERPSPFLPPFAHACLDAGADLFVGTGPHVLRGIEVYKGKPIFYSLGNFLFHYETFRVVPAEALAAFGLDSGNLDLTAYAEKVGYHKQRRFWQSVVPRLTWEGERLAAIDLYPITLGFGLAIDRRGTPHLAHGTEATQILTGLAELSKPFGTTIAIDDGIGRVQIG